MLCPQRKPPTAERLERLLARRAYGKAPGSTIACEAVLAVPPECAVKPFYSDEAHVDDAHHRRVREYGGKKLCAPHESHTELFDTAPSRRLWEQRLKRRRQKRSASHSKRQCNETSSSAPFDSGKESSDSSEEDGPLSVLEGSSSRGTAQESLLHWQNHWKQSGDTRGAQFAAGLRVWRPPTQPPSRGAVDDWLRRTRLLIKTRSPELCAQTAVAPASEAKPSLASLGGDAGLNSSEDEMERAGDEPFADSNTGMLTFAAADFEPDEAAQTPPSPRAIGAQAPVGPPMRRSFAPLPRERNEMDSQISIPSPTPGGTGATSSGEHRVDFRSSVPHAGSPSSGTRDSGASGSSSRQYHHVPADSSGERLTLLSLELVCNVSRRNKQLPHPQHDAILAVCWCVVETFSSDSETARHEIARGAILLADAPPANAREPCDASQLRSQVRANLDRDWDVKIVGSEEELFVATAAVMQERDPDLIAGWETENSSVGYLRDRGLHLLEQRQNHRGADDPTANGAANGAAVRRSIPQGAPGVGMDPSPFDVTRAFSRAPRERADPRNLHDEWGVEHGSGGIWLAGRVLLNVWRLMRSELKLNIYSQQAVCANVLRRRLPLLRATSLAAPWQTRAAPSAPTVLEAARDRAAAIRHVGLCAYATCALLERLNLIRRTAESARLYGIDFHSVLTRGSQFRVEATLLRVLRQRGVWSCAQPCPPPPTATMSARSPAKHAAAGSEGEARAGATPTANLAPYIPISPSRDQVANQRALECMALTLEPKSGFYPDPVIVVDFQSLYPSLIIAHNLCYSTICAHFDAPRGQARRPEDERLGVVRWPDQSCAADAALFAARKRGAGAGPSDQDTPMSDHAPPSDASAAASSGADDEASAPGGLFIAPNGAVFAPSHAREGVLPRMLREIIATRIMIKQALKRAEKDAGEAATRAADATTTTGEAEAERARRQKARTLARVLDARQFALKMIANVTYGYTSASFSGRMPMAELADAIVSTGRATLEHAKSIVEDPSAPWAPAEVLYGDTDSLFIHTPGRSTRAAFGIGNAIVNKINDDATTPREVVLKLEKVYQPCFLVAKKKYVGFAYSSPPAEPRDGASSGAKPSLDAKGIELARRDGCSFVTKQMEKALRLMFRATRPDLSLVRRHLERQWSRALSGRVAPSDFVFAKEVRLGHYKDGGSKPPAARVAEAAIADDERAAPRYGERVRYVVVYGSPGAKVMHVVHPPEVLFPNRLLRSLAHGGRDDMPSHADILPKRLNAKYYIEQALKALERVFALAGADVRRWFEDLPIPKLRHQQTQRPSSPPPGGINGSSRGNAQTEITQYFHSEICRICGGQGKCHGGRLGCADCRRVRSWHTACDACRQDLGRAVSIAVARSNAAQRRAHVLELTCARCVSNRRHADECASLDCPVYVAIHSLRRRRAACERIIACCLPGSSPAEAHKTRSSTSRSSSAL